MTYQFPAAAWQPPKKTPGQGAPQGVKPLNQEEFAETIADALFSPNRGGIRRRPPAQTAREMLAQLETLAREILDLAAESSTVAPFRTFTAYRMFRERLSDFQTFCGVIEGQLARLAAARRRELEERFYALWGAIYRPGLKALAAFFAVIHRDGVMPLGAREMLESEMLALEGMRHIIADPRFAAIRNDELIGEIARLVKLVGLLADRATSLPELVDTRDAA